MERLSPLDLGMLWPDDFGWPEDIGVLAVLDGNRTAGRFSLDLAREVVGKRLPLVRRMRQVLRVPRFGLGPPYWTDASTVDLEYHVRAAEVPAPGDDEQLLVAVERIRRRRLDRSRPLWEMWLLTGLAGGRTGLFVRLHHTIADGVAAVALLGEFFDPGPEVRALAAPWPVPEPEPTAVQLLADNTRRRWQAVRRGVSVPARLPATVSALRQAWPAFRELLAEERAPRTSLNTPIGPGRRFALVRGDLPLAKRIGAAHGAKVNDVLMAAMSGGLRELLRARGEPVDALALRAYVPVSLHQEPRDRLRGNFDGMMLVRLPVGVADPVRRLEMIAAETTERKKHKRSAGGGVLFRVSALQRAVLRRMDRQRWANVYAANVPGPPEPFHFAGARVLELFPIVPLIGNITLGLGALSYAGQLAITVVGDADACPDVEVFTRGAEQALEALAGSRGRDFGPADR
ncbi:wax ester/triacylglycerol synthase family O-acyltransferase [Amycolatopsis tucumanensis]|uniref:Diacylglycerol O-acyltransferase n=1 Tax=Amycolatopsis tucumanensis TaxID=401106 RepID=A0ABP7HKV5_9PSEU|nr:wax ester/triacylglycerol synthase family O-acyltransferase [Amycolatopsis tucumanensis]MCF6428978.1 wax ester/triacylglycerol synthase family O-acyltransferase [Amycolatopsis tucumanensis]